MTKVCVIYSDWLELLGFLPYSQLEKAKAFCSQNKGYFMQLENKGDIGRANNIPKDKGNYSKPPKHRPNTQSIARGELDHPSWELLAKVDAEKVQGEYPSAGEFVIPDYLKASEETSRGF